MHFKNTLILSYGMRNKDTISKLKFFFTAIVYFKSKHVSLEYYDLPIASNGTDFRIRYPH